LWEGFKSAFCKETLVADSHEDNSGAHAAVVTNTKTIKKPMMAPKSLDFTRNARKLIMYSASYE
jgi:hypothetical protein